jgi:hypothetical protein
MVGWSDGQGSASNNKKRRSGFSSPAAKFSSASLPILTMPSMMTSKFLHRPMYLYYYECLLCSLGGSCLLENRIKPHVFQIILMLT